MNDIIPRVARVLVCGGRNYVDSARLNTALDVLSRQYDFSILIQGGASGADRLAKHWANQRGIHVAEVLPYWALGRGAGLARNRAMLELRPDLVVAFPGGTGTAHMVSLAKKFEIEVVEVPA